MNVIGTSFVLGFRAAQRQLGRVWPLTALALSALAVAVASQLETHAISSEASARSAQMYVLGGAAFGLALPLLGFLLAGRAGATPKGLLSAAGPRYGADRRVFALGRLALPLIVGAGVGVLIGLLGLLLTRLGAGAVAPKVSLVSELAAVVWIGALGGAAYTAGFQLVTLFAQSWGRAAFLLGDWLLGSGVGAAALPWPRAYLRALLGGSAVLGMNEWLTSAVLLLLVLAYAALYAARVPR